MSRKPPTELNFAPFWSRKKMVKGKGHAVVTLRSAKPPSDLQNIKTEFRLFLAVSRVVSRAEPPESHHECNTHQWHTPRHGWLPTTADAWGPMRRCGAANTAHFSLHRKVKRSCTSGKSTNCFYSHASLPHRNGTVKTESRQRSICALAGVRNTRRGINMGISVGFFFS